MEGENCFGFATREQILVNILVYWVSSFNAFKILYSRSSLSRLSLLSPGPRDDGALMFIKISYSSSPMESDDVDEVRKW